MNLKETNQLKYSSIESNIRIMPRQRLRSAIRGELSHSPPSSTPSEDTHQRTKVDSGEPEASIPQKDLLGVLQDSFPQEIVALWLSAVAILQAPDTPDGYYGGVFLATLFLIIPLFIYTTREKRSGLDNNDKIVIWIEHGTQITAGVLSFAIWAYVTTQPFREKVADPILASGPESNVPVAFVGLLLLFWAVILPILTYYIPVAFLEVIKKTTYWKSEENDS